MSERLPYMKKFVRVDVLASVYCYAQNVWNHFASGGTGRPDRRSEMSEQKKPLSQEFETLGNSVRDDGPMPLPAFYYYRWHDRAAELEAKVATCQLALELACIGLRQRMIDSGNGSSLLEPVSLAGYFIAQAENPTSQMAKDYVQMAREETEQEERDE